MIEIERKQITDGTKTIKIASSWDEVNFDVYANIMKSKTLEIEDDLERSVKLLSHVSNDFKACEHWLKEMDVEDFNSLVANMEFVELKTYKQPKKKKVLNIENRFWKLRTPEEITDNEWLPQITFERLKQEYQGTEDYALAFGIVIRECDAKGKEKPFDIKTFDYVVNNLMDKVKMVDVFQQIDFFLTGVKQQYLASLPSFTIKKTK